MGRHRKPKQGKGKTTGTIETMPSTSTGQDQDQENGSHVYNLKFWNINPSVVKETGDLDQGISFIGEVPMALPSVPFKAPFKKNPDEQSQSKPSTKRSAVSGKNLHFPVPTLPVISSACKSPSGLEDAIAARKNKHQKENPSTSKTDACALPAKPCTAILRGKDTVPPYIDLQSFPHLHTVEKGLKNLRITDINAMQRCAWPHVMRGRNCLIIGGASPKQGKTLSYLVPVCARLLNDASVMPKELARGPLALILCGSVAAAKKIEIQLNLLVGKSMTVYRAMRSDENIVKNLELNPDFIICQPHLVAFFSQYFPELFGYERLRFLIIDDCHIMEREHSNDLTKVLNEIEHEISQTIYRQWPIQFILCSQEWNNMMQESFSEDSPFSEPVLVIGSFTQALRYGNVRISIDFVHSEDKYEKFLAIVCWSTQDVRHAVVVCKTRATATDLANRVKDLHGILVGYFSLDENVAIQDDIRALRTAWKNRSMSQVIMLFVTDEDLKELALTGVNTLIHFDMPLRKLDGFGERHICMWGFFPDFQFKETPAVELRSYVILTAEEPEVEKIVTQLGLLQANIPPHVSKIIGHIKERTMSTASLCNGFKLFGRCTAPDKEACARVNRHYFSKESLMANSAIPTFTKGKVNLQILGCFDVNQYLARIIAFQPIRNGRVVSHEHYEKKTQQRHNQLHQFYSMETNRVIATHPKVGDVYGVVMMKDGNPLYTRGMFDQLVYPTGDEDDFPRYRVFCLDVGLYQQLPPSQVYHLPDEFVIWCPLVVNVIITNIHPPDGGTEFVQYKKGLPGKIKDLFKDTVVTAGVVLSIENTIWVDTMKEYEYITNDECKVVLDARREFINNLHVAVDNPSHLSTMYQLCEKEGFDCGVYKSAATLGGEFQTTEETFFSAFLETSTIENPTTVSVLATYIISPDRIYVVREASVDLLYMLQDELHTEIESLIKEDYKDYKDTFRYIYEVGMCVAALDKSRKWSRAIVINSTTEQKTPKVTVRFVDHGDMGIDLTTDKVFPLPRKFVKRLPFQAICVNLAHIQPMLAKKSVDGALQWPLDAKKFLVHQLLVDKKPLKMEAIALNKRVTYHPKDPRNVSYDVFLLGHDASKSEIGEEFVQNKLAKYTPGGRKKWERFKSRMLEMWQEEVIKKTKYLNLSYNDKTADDTDDDVYEVNLGSDPKFVKQIFEDMGVPARSLDEVPRQVPVPSKAVVPSQVPVPSQMPSGVEVLEVPSTSKDNSTQQPMDNENNDNAGPSIGANRKIVRPCRKTVTIPTVKHPEVRWSQSAHHLTLRVCLTNLKKYTLELADHKRTLTFHSIDPAGYTFCLTMSGKVLQVTSEVVTGQNLTIKLEKATPLKWDTLVWEACKIPIWLKVDLEKLRTESDYDTETDSGDCTTESETDEEDRKKKQQQASLPPPPEEYDETDSSSIDDEEIERLFG